MDRQTVQMRNHSAIYGLVQKMQVRQETRVKDITKTILELEYCTYNIVLAQCEHKTGGKHIESFVLRSHTHTHTMSILHMLSVCLCLVLCCHSLDGYE